MHAPSATHESQSTATIVPLTPKGPISSPFAWNACLTSEFSAASFSEPGPHK